MSTCEVLDAFPAFLTYWAEVHSRSLDEQVEAWAGEYLAPWPELLAKQVDDYASQGLDWRQIAREKVFPYLNQRLPVMQEAHRNLLDLCQPVYDRAQRVLGFDSDALFVIHVGIGCGAGWVTPFGGRPAILYGLENMAECGWRDPETLAGVMAHEIGHLAHHHWRAQHGRPIGSGPWWQLYEEGFAVHCEGLILGTDSWHQAGRRHEEDWLDWCQGHQGWLAAEFLRAVDAGRPVTSFFGSWLEICGRSETGYYLGCEMIRELAGHLSLLDIALLEPVEARARPLVEAMAGRAGGLELAARA
jgi:hypothetical protein